MRDKRAARRRKFVHQRDEYRGLDFLIAHALDVTLIPMHRCQ